MSDNRVATHASICDLLAAAAARSPDAVALAAPGRSPLTYGGLYEQVTTCAAAMQALGLGIADRVAVVLPNGPEMAVAFLAASTATACAPLNPAYRAAEFDFYLSDLVAQAVLVQQGVPSPVREVAAKRGLKLIELVPRRDAAAGRVDLVGTPRPASGPARAPQAEDVALLLHTSGTTSRPKLVPLTHGQLCASANHVRRSLCLTPADRCLNVMPLFHIHGLVAALLATLSAGGSAACTPGFDATAFFAWLDELEPTWYTAVPTMHQAILSEAPQQREILARRPLRLIRSSSSALPPQVMLGLEDVFQAPVVEAYGMTEAAHQMCCNPLPPGVRKPGSVGLPAGPEVAIVDEQGQSVPSGATGEVVIRGPNVMRGYESNAAANATAFVQGWFRTGDLGRFDEDGYLFLAGRIKELINRGGEKISPREVDEVLLDHPAVAQAVTFAVPHVRLGEDVAAAVVLREGTPATPQQLREFALARLAGHKVPSQVVVVPEIPKGPTGKPQRIGLHERLAAQLRSEFVAPRDDFEARLAQIWAEVLRTPTIGVQDNFFALGGDSLLATQVVSRLRVHLGVDLPVSVVFRESTVAALAALVRESPAPPSVASPTSDGPDARRCDRSPDRATKPTEDLRIPRRPAVSRVDGVRDPRRAPGAESPTPLSPAQERLWFLDRLHPGSIAYNRPTNLRITGPLDAAVLQRSFDAIVRRQDVLRTVYRTVEGQPVQVVVDTPSTPLDVMDLSGLPAAAREAESRRLAVEEAQRPFDLEHGPVWRARLLRLAEQEHLLLLTIHHIAFDGWSQGVLIRELAEAYQALQAGRPPDLPELPIQYADYAAWQRAWADGPEVDGQVDYWKRQLDGAPTALELPTDHPRPAVLTERGARQVFTLPQELVQRLQRIGQQRGATLFMTLLAAFDVLLGRYAGQDDVVVGSPIAGRTRLETEGLIGLFVNTLPLRVDLSGNPPFADLLDRVRDVTLAAPAHQDVPLELLMARLLPARDLSRNAIFQCLFVLQNTPPPEYTRKETAFLPAEPVDAGTVKFDLTLEVRPGSEGWEGFCEYSTDLFERPTIARMIGHWKQLLTAIAADPGQRLGELPLLTDAERQQLLVDWNNTATETPNRCVHELFEDQVARTPDRVAVVFEGRQLTYGELNARANQLARRLQALGVGPEVLVGLCLERSLDLAVALLAVLKAGGAYVPLDSDYPRERLDFVLADCRPPVVLTVTPLADRFSAPGAHLVFLDAEHDRITRLETTNLPCRVTPDNAVYVIYTSGSTGRPKGAINLHRGVCNLLLWERADWGLVPSDRVLLKTPISFDMSVEEFFSGLASGARVVLAKPGGQRDHGYLVQLIIREGVTLTTFVPSALRAFLEEPHLELCRTLRLVSSGGETLTPDLVEIFGRRLGAKLENSYGPTETSVFVTRDDCHPGGGGSTVPIGRPGPNIQLYILDEHRHPAPIGVPGELYIGGVAVGRGYLNRPELTAERFVPDVFSDVAGQHLYRTGDRCRYLPDGNIEFLGRLDNQVKIRGNRIELGEIEAALRGHPAVAQAAVIDREDTPGERYLAAYVVTREGADDRRVGERQGVSPPVSDAATLADELRRRLRASLPEYMVPQVFEFLPDFPQLPNGKLNRKALPQPQRSATPSPPDAAPRTAIERHLAAIWVEVLGVEQVGIQDNFFERGGNSLSAMRVISRVNRTFQVDVPVRAMFDAPTVAGLAEIVQRAPRFEPAEDEAAEPAAEGLPTAGPSASEVPTDGPVFPVSFAQRRLWFLEQLEGGLVSYNMPYGFRIRGPLDRESLRRALEAIVDRHATLRTTFQVQQGEPVQVVRPCAPLAVAVRELRDGPAEQREAEVDRQAREEAERPFDLSRDRLLRAALLRLADDEHVLLVTLHHIAADGWSQAVLWRELGSLYAAYCQGDPAPLPELPTQYTDYAVRQREELRGEHLQRLAQYWRHQLAGLPPMELPTDHARPPRPTYQGAEVEFDLPDELVERLQRLSQETGSTLFMTLLAAFQMLLARYAGEHDLALGTPIAGRQQPDVEPLIGCFLNTLVLRTDLSDRPTFRGLLRRVRQVALEAFDHQDLPFEQLVEELRPERSLSCGPLIQVLFQVPTFPDRQLELAGLEVTPLPDTSHRTRVDLEVYLWRQPGGLQGTLLYRRDLWKRASMACLADQYRQLLEQIVDSPDSTLDAFSLVTRESRAVLPDPKVPLEEPPQAPVTATIADWSRRAPDQTAVRQGARSWSYRELQNRAEAIARQLQASAVAPGDVVAVYGTPSFGLIASLVGVLAGEAVLLPIDPRLPRARRQLFLDESRVRALVWLDSAAGTPEDLLDARPLPVIRVEATTGAVVGLGCRTPDPSSRSPDAPAYIFFTSGTTGTPKGVLGCHKGLSHFVRWQRETFAVGPGDRVSQLSGLSFDVVLRDVFLPLTSGGTLCLSEPPPEQPADVWHWLQRDRVTILHVVPAVLDFWLTEVPDDVSLPSVRWVFSSGEPLTDSLVRRWRERFPDSGEIVNLYGPTETTMVKTYYRVPSGSALTSGVQPVGRALPNAQALVLDANLRLCGIGERGQIVIRTPFRTLGYLNDDSGMPARFVQNPFRADPRDVLYLTGDAGRYRPDGVLEILGRLDDQVKIRGVRLEPAEIAATIGRCPGIHSCHVAAWPDLAGQKYLVAYVVPEQGSGITPLELRQHVDRLLPAPMVPAHFVLLDRLPLTPNGKVDRRALPIPDAATVPAGYVAPRTPWEEQLAAIWAAVLGRERIGVHDNFFELGGHSLLVIRVVSRVRDALRIELPVRRLFETPTIAGLAASLQDHAEARPVLSAPAIRRAARGAELPLSFAQQRLWFLDQLEPHSSAYHMPQAFCLTGPLDVPVLERCLGEIVRRHEVLRTTYLSREGEPFQRINPDQGFPLPVIDLTRCAESDRDQELRRVLDEEAARPFDLRRDRMLRASLLRRGRDEHVLLMTLHHIAADGWSLGVLFRELSALYAAFATSRASPLNELPIQYADYAIWQRQYLQGALLDEQVRYWQRQLAGAPAVVTLPGDRPRPAVQTYRGARQSWRVSRDLTRSLAYLSRREGATLFMTLLAGFQTLLARHTGQEDIVVGSAIAGRHQVEIEPLIGFFVNTLVLRSDLSGNPTFRELLARVRDVTLGAYAHQDLPFERLVEELQPPRNRSHPPLFQVMFVLQNAPEEVLHLPGLMTQGEQLARTKAKFDLTLSLTPGESGLQASIEYNTDLFEAATITRLAGHYETLLHGIAADPDQPIGQLPLLSAAERRQLLVEWNGAPTEYPSQRCVHDLFQEQAARTPDAVALTFQNRTLTYRDLNARANQWAHHLQRCGVGPDVPVGLCVERSVEMVVGLLAILKAGGAYVPLDPHYAPERLAYLLQDTRVPVVLMQQELVPRLPSTAARLICLDRDAEQVANESPENLPCATTAENLAYVVYTSGSTGVPKGVCIPHRGVVRLVQHTDYVRFGPEEVFLQFSPLSFDAATFEIWGCLLHGARLVIFPPGLPSAAELGETIQDAGITTLWLTAGLFQEMVDQQLDRLCGLRQLLAGGDVLSAPHVQRALRELRGCTIINGYGPTENTTFSCCYPMRHVDQVGRSVPIGRPVANTEAYVLDRHLQPVPVGVPGELYLGGDGLARGYLNQPELTAERFLPHPFRSDAAARVYRTGDWVRWLPDGNLEFIGRMDHQVKIRGFRVELGEVEAVLSRHPGLSQCAVVAREDLPGHKRLAAFGVPADTSRPPTSDELRAFLRQQLPEFMLPAVFTLLPQLPLTPHGKVDRQALSAAPLADIDRKRRYVPPSDPSQVMLRQLWEELLGVSRIGMRDDFFELGGNSLLAVQMLGRIEELSGVRVPVAALFAEATIESLAHLLLETQRQQQESPLVEVQAGQPGRRPFFFWHGDFNGGGLYCRNVARHVGPDQPFYAIHPHGMGGQPARATIEAMAADHLQLVRERQPEGPYLLGGNCNGALEAFEIAQRLRAAGQQVDLLVMLGPPRRHRRSLTSLAYAGLRYLLRSLYPLLDSRLLARRLPALRWLALYGLYAAACRSYCPTSYDGRVALLRPRERLDPVSDPAAGWQTVAPNLDVHLLPGGHSTSVTVHAQALGEQLRKCLDRVGQ